MVLFNLSNICEIATVNVEQEIAEVAQFLEMGNVSQDKSPEMERTAKSWINSSQQVANFTL